jgi:hypothetical protein
VARWVFTSQLIASLAIASEARCLNFIETSNFVDSLQLVLSINTAKYASILQKRTGKCLFDKRYSKQMKQSIIAKTAINKNLSGSDYHLASGTTQSACASLGATLAHYRHDVIQCVQSECSSSGSLYVLPFHSGFNIGLIQLEFSHSRASIARFIV